MFLFIKGCVYFMTFILFNNLLDIDVSIKILLTLLASYWLLMVTIDLLVIGC